MKITLKIKEGPNPDFLFVKEREGDLFEAQGVKLFVCKPSDIQPHFRVYCAKTGLGFSNFHKTADEALLSAAVKFKVYGTDTLKQLIEEGCKNGGYINLDKLADLVVTDTFTIPDTKVTKSY